MSAVRGRCLVPVLWFLPNLANKVRRLTEWCYNLVCSPVVRGLLKGVVSGLCVDRVRGRLGKTATSLILFVVFDSNLLMCICHELAHSLVSVGLELLGHLFVHPCVFRHVNCHIRSLSHLSFIAWEREANNSAMLQICRVSESCLLARSGVLLVGVLQMHTYIPVLSFWHNCSMCSPLRKGVI